MDNLQAFLHESYKNGNFLLTRSGSITWTEFNNTPFATIPDVFWKMIELVPAPGAGLALQFVDLLATVMNGSIIPFSIMHVINTEYLTLISMSLIEGELFRPSTDNFSMEELVRLSDVNTPIYLQWNGDVVYEPREVIYSINYRVVRV